MFENTGYVKQSEKSQLINYIKEKLTLVLGDNVVIFDRNVVSFVELVDGDAVLWVTTVSTVV